MRSIHDRFSVEVDSFQKVVCGKQVNDNTDLVVMNNNANTSKYERKNENRRKVLLPLLPEGMAIG